MDQAATGAVDKVLLECSVCLTLPQCNIYQCTKSDAHLLCKDCHSQLSKPPKCPVCREPFPRSPRRSHLAEQMVASLYQSAKTTGGPKISTPPLGHQNGFSEEEELNIALQESLKISENDSAPSGEAGASSWTVPTLPMTVGQTADLWLKLDRLHSRYVEWRENPDMRETLEGYAYQYLTVVPQDRRFCQPGFGDSFIAGSARMIPDFSAEKAAQAFNLIEGVIIRPRKYRKNIQKASPRTPRSKLDHCLQSLYGADRLFQQLGYQFSSLTCQGYHSTFLVREGAVDTETAMLVARDCLLASVECKILTTAMQVLSINGVSATWEELISFRRERVGTPQQIALHFAIETGLPLTAPWPETTLFTTLPETLD